MTLGAPSLRIHICHTDETPVVGYTNAQFSLVSPRRGNGNFVLGAGRKFRKQLSGFAVSCSTDTTVGLCLRFVHSMQSPGMQL